MKYTLEKIVMYNPENGSHISICNTHGSYKRVGEIMVQMLKHKWEIEDIYIAKRKLNGKKKVIKVRGDFF